MYLRHFGDDLPPCETAAVGQPCASSSMNTTPASLVITAADPAPPASTYDPSLPSCANAAVGQKCNSVTAQQASDAAASDSANNKLLMIGGIAVAAWFLLFRKGSRR